jgi:hypothetical protein
MKKKIGPKQIHVIPCPTCGAAPGKNVSWLVANPAQRRIVTAD